MITPINQQTLQTYLPFTRDVKGSKIYDSYVKPMEDADRVLKVRLLGTILYNKLKTAFAATTLPTNAAVDESEYVQSATLEDIREACIRYITNQAAYMAAGKADLIQTAFGFGTVSGQQEAIASTARVEAMRRDCQTKALEAWDDLIKMLIGNDYTEDEARASVSWRSATRFLVWTQDDVRELTEVEELDAMSAKKVKITDAQAGVANIISKAQLDAILDAMRSGVVTDAEQELIDICRRWMSCYMSNDPGRNLELSDIRQDIYELLQNNKESFTEWAASDKASARKTEPFKNDVNSPGYWM